MKRIKCPLCNDSFTKVEGLYEHLEEDHDDEMPADYSASRYYYYTKTGKTHGSCVVCKKDTEWNESTKKYHRFCGNPKCKDAYVKEFRKRMIGKYGKSTLLNDPEQQKKMLANRSISGKYKWSDGTEKTYTGSYELDFLKFLDVFMNFESSDVMTPSPHTYYYIYKGEKHFYIPDVYIPSLNLEIEIKDGGDNPNMHHKIQEVDKVKEELKDEVMASVKDYDYLKIVNKQYGPFFEYLNKRKEEVIKAKLQENVNQRPVIESIENDEVLQEASNNNKYPVYVILFQNKTGFGNVIRKVTKQDFTHAAISLDTSMNEMYSFASIPYLRGLHKLGFIRESIYSPLYLSNNFFNVYVMFVDKQGYDKLQSELEYFKRHYDKYNYSTIGLIEYMLSFKKDKGYSEGKKLSWFCSEFVAYLINEAKPGTVDNYLVSPGDLAYNPEIKFVKQYNIDTFDEKDLIRQVKKVQSESLKESVDEDILTEGVIRKIKDSLVEMITSHWMNPIIKKYTTFIDWKRIKIEYEKRFKGDTNNRFFMTELIIFNKLVKDKIAILEENVTDFIIDEMDKIYNSLKEGKEVVIKTVDVINKKIYYVVNGVLRVFQY